MSFLTTRDNSPHARFQIFLVGAGDLGWDRALAHAEKRSKQKFTAGMGAILHPGHYRVVVPGE